MFNFCLPSKSVVRGYVANVAVEAEVVDLFDRIQQDFGQIDGLVNNAGITRYALLIKHKNGKTKKMSLQAWQQVIDVNLTGVFLCGREAAAKMLEAGKPGVIVNISSICRDGNIGQSNYSAAKAGVSALTATWGKELARHGIRVGAVAPGFANTEMVKSVPEPMLDKLKGLIPLHRLAEPAEIAHTVRYIIENDYFTTRIIPIGGGMQEYQLSGNVQEGRLRCAVSLFSFDEPGAERFDCQIVWFEPCATESLRGVSGSRKAKFYEEKAMLLLS